MGKDYAYRSTWKHKFSRARNLAQRGGLTKKEMMKKYGRFPRRGEWWGADGSYAAWKARWVKLHPREAHQSSLQPMASSRAEMSRTVSVAAVVHTEGSTACTKEAAAARRKRTPSVAEKTKCSR